MSQGETYKNKGLDDYLKMGLLGVGMLGVGGRVVSRAGRAIIPWIGKGYYTGKGLPGALYEGYKSTRHVAMHQGPREAAKAIITGKPMTIAKLEYQAANLKRKIANKYKSGLVEIKDQESLSRLRSQLKNVNAKWLKTNRAEQAYSSAVQGPIGGNPRSFHRVDISPEHLYSTGRAQEFSNLTRAVASDGKTPLAKGVWGLKDRTKINYFDIVDRKQLGELSRIAKSDERFRFLKWGLEQGYTPSKIMNPTKKMIQQSGIKLPPTIHYKKFMQGMGVNKVDGKLQVSYVPSHIEKRPWSPRHNELVESLGDTTVAGHTVNATFSPGTKLLFKQKRRTYHHEPSSMEGFDKTDFTGTFSGRLLDPFLGKPTFMSWKMI